MKATHTKTPATFAPVTITITCETQEELDALACLFNYGHATGAIRQVFGVKNPEVVHQAAIELGASLTKHRKFFQHLEEDIRVTNGW